MQSNRGDDREWAEYALTAARARKVLIDRLRRGLSALWLNTADLTVKGAAHRLRRRPSAARDNPMSISVGRSPAL